MQGLILSGFRHAARGPASATLDLGGARLGSRQSATLKYVLVALAAAVLAALCSGRATAQTCSTTSQPYTFTNGATADATQVMADLNCAGIYSLANTSLNIGIGFTAPAAKLDVNGIGHFAGACNPNVGNQGAYIGWNTLTCGTGETDFINNQGGGPGGFAFMLSNTAGTTRTTAVFINGAGSVGIGTTSPSSTLYVNGSAGGASAWTNASDARLKQDIVEIPDALSLLTRLRGVRFNWRPTDQREVGKTLNLPLDQPQIGFIAQEVEAVVPEAVTVPQKGGDEIYSVQETKIVPILVEAVKQQQSQIAKQSEQIAAQTSEIARQSAALEHQQKQIDDQARQINTLINHAPPQ